MNLGDLSRINTNVQSMSALGQLNKTNSELGVRQMRLATGSRLNRAEDDSAGYTIANKLQAKTRGQAQALANIGDAKGMLTVGEGALNSTMDILQTMKEKAVQAANDTMGSDERTAIQNQLDALKSEIDDVLGGAEFNGTKLFGGGDAADSDSDAATLNLSFQVGSGSSDTFGVSVNALSTSTLGEATEAASAVTAAAAVDAASINDAGGGGAAILATDIGLGGTYSGSADTSVTFTVANSGADLTYDLGDGNGTQTIAVADGFQGVTIDLDANTTGNVGDGDSFAIDFTAAKDAVQVGDAADLALDVTNTTTAQATIDQIDSAIDKVNSAVSSLGDSQARLSIKQDNLDTSMTNYEAARSRISDTDFAKEQMEIVKLQILQQTGIGSLAQANSGPQSVLSLIG